jgi:hypothetical protein
MENTENVNSEIIDDFSPLTQDNVIQRDYTKPKVDYSQVNANPIEEPVFVAPSFEDMDANWNSKNVEDAQIVDEKSSANPYTENLDKKDQRKASAALVEALLDGYTQLNKFGNKLVQFNPEKIQAMMRSGEIDPDLTIPINGRNIGVLDYVNAYNEETSSVISVDDDFKDKVRPLLIEEFMERNIGMTRLQLIGYYFGTDLLTKGTLVYSLRKQNQAVLDSLVEISQNNRPAPTPQASRVQQSEPIRAEEPQAKPQREFVEPEEEYTVVEDFEPVTVLNTANDDVNRSRRPQAGPKFGDSAILEQMEKIANGEPSGKRRGRPRKK